MRKKALKVAASLALVSTVALTPAAFAAPSDGRLDPKDGGGEPVVTSVQPGEDKAEVRIGEGRGRRTSGAVETCDGESIKLKAGEKRTLDLHNETREKHGLGSLCVDPTLTRVARFHSKAMMEEGYFSHASKNGESPGDRLNRSGYDWETYGENIAWGSGSYGTPEGTFERWMKSPGHRKNILEKNFREVGIGEHEGEEGRVFSTVDFGTRRQLAAIRRRTSGRLRLGSPRPRTRGRPRIPDPGVPPVG